MVLVFDMSVHSYAYATAKNSFKVGSTPVIVNHSYESLSTSDRITCPPKCPAGQGVI